MCILNQCALYKVESGTNYICKRARGVTLTRGSQEPVIAHLIFNLTSKAITGSWEPLANVTPPARLQT
jgi:hypothetical protein